MTAASKFTPPNDEVLGGLRAFMEAQQAFRTVDPAMPSSYVVAFLAVALDPGHGTVHYSKVLGMLQPVCSRILLEIGQKTRTGGQGLNLVDSEYDKVDLRLKRYFLTTQGKALLSQVERAMSRRRKGT